MLDTKATLGPEITLVPNSGIQFITIPFNIHDVTGFSPRFIERKFSEQDIYGKPVDVIRLLQGWNQRNKAEPPPFEAEGEDKSYDISKERALEPFLNKWVPVPYLRVSRAATKTTPVIWDVGPTDWARVRISPRPETSSSDEPSHVAVFAFDTLIDTAEPPPAPLEPDRKAPYVPYITPRAAELASSFEFVSEMNALDRVLADPHKVEITNTVLDFQRWLVEWLDNLFTDFMRKKVEPRELDRARDFRYALEHVARWIAMVDLLKLAAHPPSIRFIDTITGKVPHVPVEVDLILDVGNSRTCGMLIEDFPNDDLPGMSNTMTLGLRDLTEVEKVYREPFDSHIEFSEARFGDDALSQENRRSKAFYWPSIVRVGKEATRLRTEQNDGNDSLCGMSSPKRYLWDVDAAVQPWRFQTKDYSEDGVAPATWIDVRSLISFRGDVVSRVRQDEDLYEKLYPHTTLAAKTSPGHEFTSSRSSMYTFMLAELIWQAFVSINNPEVRAQRKQSGIPRRLRRVIVTMPTAVPSREQRIMRSRARAAVNLLWELMDWSKAPPRGTSKPIVEVMWDEASCAQLVWLYGEIAENFNGGIRSFYELMGRPRKLFTADAPPLPGAADEPSLRVASIDIGGGTTDLMITTYFQQDNRAIVPVQTFRESMRIAGDDIVKSVIEQVLMPAVAAHLRQAGLSDPMALLRELFSGDRADFAIQLANRRRQFVHRLLQPAALGLLSAYEAMSGHDYGAVEVRPLRELIPDFADIPTSTFEYLVGPAMRLTGAAFDVGDVGIPVDPGQMREAVRQTLNLVMGNMCEAINHFDCDVVLLSGRPSKLPAIMEMVVDTLAVPPDRLVAMHRYRPGAWYPFLSRQDARIADPKTTAVVGGTLCAMADRRIRNFMVFTDAFQMRSTAKFIGPLERNGELKEAEVRFTDAELYDSKLATRPKRLPYFSQQVIGYRQLPFERWTATPLYLLDEKAGGAKLQKPVMVSLRRSEVQLRLEETGDDPEKQRAELQKRESAREELEIEDAEANGGAPARDSMVLSLRTLDSNSSYWLDTGILNV